ncbi:hypothetical protein JL720_942 [Aureococcus anophagefferens]|nr:hypothetical protein JL720_942 [Aureococcus anophagefferens]
MGLLERSQSVLGLSPLSSDGDVRKSFRRLSLEHHPDRNPDDVDGATKRFQAISSAYAYLTSEAGSAEAGRAAEAARRAAERCDFAERRRKPAAGSARARGRRSGDALRAHFRRAASDREAKAHGVHKKRRPLDPLPRREKPRDAAADAAEQDARAAAVRRSAFEAARLRKARQALDDRRHAEEQRLREAAMREAAEAREAEEAERAAREAHERAEADEAEARDRRFRGAAAKARETRDAARSEKDLRRKAEADFKETMRREEAERKLAALEARRGRRGPSRSGCGSRGGAPRRGARATRRRAPPRRPSSSGSGAGGRRAAARRKAELERLKRVARAKLEAMDARRREAVAMANEDEIARAARAARRARAPPLPPGSPPRLRRAVTKARMEAAAALAAAALEDAVDLSLIRHFEATPWTCAACTFVNAAPEFLCCGTCGSERPPGS